MDVKPDISDDADDALTWGGASFRSSVLEARFEEERLPETRRHARALLIAAALLNIGFLPIDWRFFGTPHFWVAVPARLGVIATALLCLLFARRDVGVRALRRTLIAWMAGTALGVAFLVSSHSVLAQFVVVMLPVAYYLAVPVPFRWSLAGGTICSVMLLSGFQAMQPVGREDLGLMLAALTMNVALAMSLMRSNRLGRVAWQSARATLRLSEALADSRASLERIFLASPVPLVLTTSEDGRVLAMSRSAAALLGEQHPRTLRQLYASDGAPDPLMQALVRGGGVAELETPAALADGTTRTLLIRSTVIDGPTGPAVLSCLIDITQRKAVQVSLEYIASTDALTGLRNRMSFLATSRAEMTRAVRARASLSLLMLDIDHFKAINDTHGHSAGDAVLRGFAGICRDVLGVDAIVGRLGGEEFGVLLPDTTLGAARSLAERLREATASARTASGEAHIAITISVGVARVLPQERDLDQSLARADLALYAAKRGGRNRVMVEADGDDDVERARR